MNIGRKVLALTVAVSLVAGSMLTGCASQAVRVGQFHTFAQAGMAYADALPQVLDVSFAATVATDSLVLAQTRSALSEDDRRAELSRSTKSLQARMEILNSLKQHARLLRSYFVAIQAVATTDATSSGLTDITSGLVAELGNLSPTIRNASIGEVKVEEMLPPLAQLAVASFQSQVLESELQRNGETIQRELDLQAAALQSIADAMKADLEAQITAEDRERVERPFVQESNLPADWGERRLASLQRQANLQAVDAAVRAARSLRESFVALVENRLNATGVSALVQDVNEILSFVESL